MSDVDLHDRIAALERSARRIIPASEGQAGLANFVETRVESRVVEESAFLQAVVAEAMAMFRADIVNICKAMIEERLAHRICGTFDSKASYSMGDVVAMDGASFIARQDNPGSCPGGGWQLMSRQGSRGIAGPKGAPGKDAPRLSGFRIDAANFEIVPLLSDGSYCPPIELRALFEAYNRATT
jgi:hypothetical protein